VTRRAADCRPSKRSRLTLTMTGTDSEVIQAAAEHAVSTRPLARSLAPESMRREGASLRVSDLTRGC
jgi:hypothetical protein